MGLLGVLGESSDVGDKQKHIIPEIHKHIYLSLKLNFSRVLYKSFATH